MSDTFPLPSQPLTGYVLLDGRIPCRIVEEHDNFAMVEFDDGFAWYDKKRLRPRDMRWPQREGEGG